MRVPGFAIGGLGLALLAGAVVGGGPAVAEVSRQATPAATPAAVTPAPTPDPAAAAPTAVPAQPAAPAAPVTTDVVTLVMWYANDPSGEFINVVPIAIDGAQTASPQAAAAIGRADFPEDGTPSITLGETRFDTYARSEGDIPERWTWFDDIEGARPATLVMQVSGSGGPYSGFFGTATFVSRDEGGAGGVLVLALRPAAPAADAAAEPAPAEPAPVDPAADPNAGAAEPDPDLPEPTDEVAEPSA